jgi:hypothetical protein
MTGNTAFPTRHADAGGGNTGDRRPADRRRNAGGVKRCVTTAVRGGTRCGGLRVPSEYSDAAARRRLAPPREDDCGFLRPCCRK